MALGSEKLPNSLSIENLDACPYCESFLLNISGGHRLKTQKWGDGGLQHKIRGQHLGQGSRKGEKRSEEEHD